MIYMYAIVRFSLYGDAVGRHFKTPLVVINIPISSIVNVAVIVLLIVVNPECRAICLTEVGDGQCRVSIAISFFKLTVLQI